MALGARGVSLLFASGDGGARGRLDDPTICNNNTFLALFPASCPYGTAVGGTTGINPEIAAPLSGGGFSSIFPRPSYQDYAIPPFLNSLPPNFPGIFNRSGRGLPDISTQAVNFTYILGGNISELSGTSFASPTFASIIILINDRLIAAGKPVLGFLNPWIYSSAFKTFTDITEGKNTGFVCPSNTVSYNMEWVSAMCLWEQT